MSYIFIGVEILVIFVGLHVPYTLQTTITCDHTAQEIFPSKNIAHLIN